MNTDVGLVMDKLRPVAVWEYAVTDLLGFTYRKSLRVVRLSHAGVVTFEVEGKQYMDRLAVLAQKLLDNSGILVNATEAD